MNALFSIHLLKMYTRFWFIPLTIVTCEFNKNNIKLTPLNYFNYYTYKKINKNSLDACWFLNALCWIRHEWIERFGLFFCFFCLHIFILEFLSKIIMNVEPNAHFTQKNFIFAQFYLLFFNTYQLQIAVYDYRKWNNVWQNLM